MLKIISSNNNRLISELRVIMQSKHTRNAGVYYHSKIFSPPHFYRGRDDLRTNKYIYLLFRCGECNLRSANSNIRRYFILLELMKLTNSTSSCKCFYVLVNNRRSLNVCACLRLCEWLCFHIHRYAVALFIQTFLVSPYKDSSIIFY